MYAGVRVYVGIPTRMRNADVLDRLVLDLAAASVPTGTGAGPPGRLSSMYACTALFRADAQRWGQRVFPTVLCIVALIASSRRASRSISISDNATLIVDNEDYLTYF